MPTPWHDDDECIVPTAGWRWSATIAGDALTGEVSAQGVWLSYCTLDVDLR